MRKVGAFRMKATSFKKQNYKIQAATNPRLKMLNCISSETQKKTTRVQMFITGLVRRIVRQKSSEISRRRPRIQTAKDQA